MRRLAFALALFAASLAHAAPPAPKPAEASCPPAVADGTPQPVIVGIYLTQIAAIDVKANTFLADFYLWFRWRGKIDPTRTYELVNAIEQWDFMREAVYKDDEGEPKAEELADGCRFQQFHIQGRFAH